jgi:hypothetical protein
MQLFKGIFKLANIVTLPIDKEYTLMMVNLQVKGFLHFEFLFTQSMETVLELFFELLMKGKHSKFQQGNMNIGWIFLRVQKLEL